ncbi:MAG: GNAT family N-acetyltransferase [Propionibacteriaceae bacterium]
MPIGRGRVSAAGEFYNISDLLIASHMLGTGLGRQMMTAMTCAGRRLGATTGVLQVEADNARAITLYRSLGWQDQGGYHFRTLTASVASAVTMTAAGGRLRNNSPTEHR